MSRYHKLNMKATDLWALILCTVRYALGRCSYVTSEAEYLVRTYGIYLEQWQLAQIAREIRDAVENAHTMGGTLGMEMDERAWVRLAEDIDLCKVEGRTE
jgi:hypothetical protein